MIDFWGVWINSFWITGLTVLLATYSYCDWMASQQDCKLSTITQKFIPSLFLNLGLLLFCLGLLGTSNSWLERLGWLIMLILILLQIALSIREHHQDVNS